MQLEGRIYFHTPGYRGLRQKHFPKYLSTDQWFLLAIFFGRGIRWFRRSLSRSFERGLSRTLWRRGLSTQRWSARLLGGPCGGAPRNRPCDLMLDPHDCRSKFVLLYTQRFRLSARESGSKDTGDYRTLSDPRTYLPEASDPLMDFIPKPCCHLYFLP